MARALEAAGQGRGGFLAHHWEAGRGVAAALSTSAPPWAGTRVERTDTGRLPSVGAALPEPTSWAPGRHTCNSSISAGAGDADEGRALFAAGCELAQRAGDAAPPPVVDQLQPRMLELEGPAVRHDEAGAWRQTGDVVIEVAGFCLMPRAQAGRLREDSERADALGAPSDPSFPHFSPYDGCTAARWPI